MPGARGLLTAGRSRLCSLDPDDPAVPAAFIGMPAALRTRLLALSLPPATP